MVRLDSIQGEPLVRIVRDVSPIKCQSNKLVNRLLDGTYHVQIIGEPAKSIDALVIASFNQAEQLNAMVDQGALMVLVHHNKKYFGYIDEEIGWKKLNYGNGDPDRSFCEGKLTLIIKEEVML